MVKRPSSIEGKLVGIRQYYLNKKFESSQIDIKVKTKEGQPIRFDYSTEFYGLIPKEFLGKNIELRQRYDPDKKTLYQEINLKRNLDYVIESFTENIPN